MQAFQFAQAASAADAARAAAGGAKLLAGGQSLLPTMRMGLATPETVVDLGALADLRGITVANGVVKIGAMTTHATVAASAEVQKAIPALADLAGRIGDRQVRNRGTLGGSLANNDPAACYPAASPQTTSSRVCTKPHWPRARSSPPSASRCPRRPAGRSSNSRRRASPSSACS
jgi:aerobic carbon-monoxide dehydrogenase medium subunit